MTNPIIPYSFVPGTKAKANEVNANFIAVADNISTVTTTVETKLNKDLSNINSAGLDFIKNNTAPSRNIGEIVASTIPLTDAGLHLLDGALLQYGSYKAFIDYLAGLVTDYPDLFVTEADWQTAVTTYGVCGKFVYDAINNTIRLPKITGKLDGTIDTAALGDLAEQYVRLPNITGQIFGCGLMNDESVDYQSGALYQDRSRTTAKDANTASSNSYGLGFNASFCSSVYSGNGTDTKIHEQAIKCYYYIVIATSTKTEIQIDIDEIATDLNGKADTDLTNCTDVANIKMAHNAMPSNTHISLTVGASGATYTAPADGWFTALNATGNMGWVCLRNTTNGVHMTGAPRGGLSDGSAVIPVKKNDIVTFDYIDNSGNNFNSAYGYLRFVYANGSESEAQ